MRHNKSIKKQSFLYGHIPNSVNCNLKTSNAEHLAPKIEDYRYSISSFECAPQKFIAPNLLCWAFQHTNKSIFMSFICDCPLIDCTFVTRSSLLDFGFQAYLSFIREHIINNVLGQWMLPRDLKIFRNNEVNPLENIWSCSYCCFSILKSMTIFESE